ncbi:MAG: MFS transporter [Candidatus Pristimantibacillus lignocellulolyticus]|uniref:MFS transporter n=1 Tax=Candidatus Pristimantibacillus lignocellulolyticus TaxID=2994561 RepID=A0A9J6ZKA3_9BACL|nr:MAG: MFS transporter [Candidatus Pristimantibacillus lignocellulolyticus]
MKATLSKWKYPSILLFGIGVSNLGEWIYFIAFNLIILDMTGSAFAVSMLYVIRPLATIMTNFWAGSVIDRFNKKKMMVLLDISRASLIAILPLLDSVLWIYFWIFIISMGNSIFGTTSMTYITKLIPLHLRKRFNSLHSLVSSSAFLIGPAIAGVLFIIGSPTMAIFVYAIGLFLSGLITLLMPDVEKNEILTTEDNKLTLRKIRLDWKAVGSFSSKNKYVMLIYFLFTFITIVLASGVDSLEAAFSKQVLSLTDSDYSFLVTIAGAGAIVGALINSVIVKNISISLLIGLGTVFISVGYSIYAFSNTFTMAAAGFFILSFFNAYANTGFLTFFQNNIPVHIMGRVGSVYGLIQSIFVIIITILMGLVAEVDMIQMVVITVVLLMLVISLILLLVAGLPSKREVFKSEFVNEKFNI